MSKIDELARIAAKAGLNDNVVPESPYRREEDYLGAIAAYFDEGGGGGSGGGGNLIVHDVDGTLDKTWQDIYDALSAGRICILLENYSHAAIQSIIIAATYDSPASTYFVRVPYSDGEDSYKTNDADGYPVYVESQ